MKFRRSRARRSEPVINLTPMIDVAVTLIFFFVVSTEFIRERESGEGEQGRGLEVDLPRANADLMIEDARDLRISIQKDGAVFVDEEPVDDAGLRRRLSAAAEADADILVVIKADKGVAHGRVVGVMDAARALGLSRLAIATESEGEGNGAGTP